MIFLGGPPTPLYQRQFAALGALGDVEQQVETAIAARLASDDPIFGVEQMQAQYKLKDWDGLIGLGGAILDHEMSTEQRRLVNAIYGIALVKTGQYEQAILFLTAAVNAGLETLDVMQNRAEAYAKTGDFEKAAADAEQAARKAQELGADGIAKAWKERAVEYKTKAKAN